MAWSAPHVFVVFEVLTAAHMNAIGDDLTFLKSGAAAFTSVVANVGPTAGTVELTVATLITSFDGSTQILLEYTWFVIDKTVPGDTFAVRLYDGGTQVGGARVEDGSGGVMRAVITPSAGSHTFTAKLVRTAGSGTATQTSTVNNPAFLTTAQMN